MEYLNFSEANCQNCYKCIRTCKVKAIKITDQQATIIPELCVGCGECFSICPQNAKSVKTDIDYVKELIKQNKKIIVSLAPSFPSFDNLKSPLSFISGLRELGFSEIEETSIGASLVSEKYKEEYYSEQQHIITSSCPTVNFLITKYYHEHVKYLSETLSPMMVHNKLIKNENEGVYTVFIGPCISKKEETRVCTSKNSCIDAVITFDDIRNWLKEENIDLNTLEPSKFDKESELLTKWYPLSGGVEKATINEPSKDRRVIKIDGMQNCKEFLESLDDIKGKTWIEMNACKSGCINGYGNSLSDLSLNNKIENVLNYIDNCKESEKSEKKCNVGIDFDYSIFVENKTKVYSDDEIREVLKRSGKYVKSDELNCGACGYNTCKEKAVAVLNNMAEIEMCLPYMRMINEEMSSVIIENTPNGIIVATKDFEIVEFNPASVDMFMISKKNAIGQHAKSVIGNNVFKKLENNSNHTIITKEAFNDISKIMIVSLKYIQNHDLYLAIFKDVTKEEMAKIRNKDTSINALEMAQKVIDKQMIVAHEIASLLGETTAETKVTLSKLKKLFDEKNE
ncbi:hypothetical protein CI105_02390 [Candidatus Izimaplasma bacterium ZiA1]|uniref:[Fe-Fe] hydrogenase large subunit C-terminal domain-containing protein n=1 Tax=Candidatus Izimoplasma sp. ZiA1 TaxID=2024899 RepID=UPI000BAA6562|nr:hypothetical protein CI105_02390 [Candidatus Izimaplasma bacterium ZiA1]